MSGPDNKEPDPLAQLLLSFAIMVGMGVFAALVKIIYTGSLFGGY